MCSFDTKLTRDYLGVDTVLQLSHPGSEQRISLSDLESFHEETHTHVGLYQREGEIAKGKELYVNVS